MKSLLESRKFLLLALSIAVFGLFSHGSTGVLAPEVAQAGVFDTAKSLTSGVLDKIKGITGNAGAVAQHARGICFKGDGASPGFTPGFAIPYPSCNGGFSKLGIPIPDCDLPGGCFVPAGCLNLICAKSSSAIYSQFGDPTRGIPPTCACSGADVGSGVKSLIKSFLPF